MLTKEEKRKRFNEYQNRRRANGNRKYQGDWLREHKKKHPEKWRGYHNKWQRKRYALRKGTPRVVQTADVRLAKNQASCRKYYHDNKSNPEFKARRKASHNRSRARRSLSLGRAWSKTRCEAIVSSKTLVVIEKFYIRVRAKLFIRCYYCGRPTRTSRIELDHIVPISGKTERGRHEIDNICASCMPCNRTKSNKQLSEWKPMGQMVLPF